MTLFAVNTAYPLNQTTANALNPKVTTDANGDVIFVSWEEHDALTDSHAIMVYRIDVSAIDQPGSPCSIAGPYRVDTSGTTGIVRSDVSIAHDNTSNSLAVAWWEGSFPDPIHPQLRLITADPLNPGSDPSQRQLSEPPLVPVGAQTGAAPRVSLAAGGVLGASWNAAVNDPYGLTPNVFARTYQVGGSLSLENKRRDHRVDFSPRTAYADSGAIIAENGGADFLHAYRDNRNGAHRVFVRRLSSDPLLE